MPFGDRYDLPLSTSSVTAVEHYRDGVDRLLVRDAGADDALEAALAADAGFALANAARALLWHQQGSADQARAAAAQAQALASGLSRREQQHVD